MTDPHWKLPFCHHLCALTYSYPFCSPFHVFKIHIWISQPRSVGLCTPPSQLFSCIFIKSFSSPGSHTSSNTVNMLHNTKIFCVLPRRRRETGVPLSGERSLPRDNELSRFPNSLEGVVSRETLRSNPFPEKDTYLFEDVCEEIVLHCDAGVLAIEKALQPSMDPSGA